ncbi:MAG: hypothetical protein KGR16_02370 [Verrucomicrobia bacterium]|nr:hypothetical protein [Verrucomicrobiota bacterium]MDE3047129.1 hypothetical protein [Verrucomicrobiota bacterium]
MSRYLLKAAILLQLTLAIYLICEVRGLRKRLYAFQRKTLSFLRQHELLAYEFQAFLEQRFKVLEFPRSLKHLPLAEEQGILLASRKIDIPGVIAPYNASLIEEADHYLLFFRYDIPAIGDDEVPYHSYIGCVELNSDFLPLSPFTTLDTKSAFSEDPRVMKVDGQYFITYNELMAGKRTRREVRMATVDSLTKRIESITRFDRRKMSVEKNWMPFVPDGKTLHFIYTIRPHEVLKLASPQHNALLQVGVCDPKCALSSLDWPKQWGIPRGGTPPRLVDGEYLSFFHSSLIDDRGITWYVMGAYAFEAAAPYRITKISPHPILFHEIYRTAHQNTANPKVRCIYPAGFVLERREGKDLIQLSCGENDSAVKVLTIDKEALLRSLKPVSSGM